jgi:hypothetical protein
MSRTTVAQGVKVFEAIADGPTKRKARALIDQGRGQWVVDPHVAGVVGLLMPETNRAWLIVYVDDQDFEVGSDFDQLMGA